MNSPTDIETRLRASLQHNARQAPPGAPLADRILAELDAPVLRPRAGWRTWTFPLLAAAAIAAVALALVGIGNSGHGAAPAVSPGASHTFSAQPRPTPTPTPTTAPHTTRLPLLAMGGVRGFRAADTTYVGTDRIWALGHAACGQGTCLAMVHSADSGHTWQRVPIPSVAATSVRFANAQTGFLFGPQVLERTSDGGAHWTPDAGGADALETLNDTVIKVSSSGQSCNGSCQFHVSYAPLGTSTWTDSTIAPIRGYSVQLLRANGISYLLVRTTDPVLPEAQGQLYRSSDGGASWHRSRACTHLRSAALSADGTLDLLCDKSILVDADTDSAHSVPQSLGQSAGIAAVDAHTIILVGDTLYRSTDGGVVFNTVLDRTTLGNLGPPGFQNDKVGRWLDDGGRTLWTTTDAGAHWTGAAFSR